MSVKYYEKGSIHKWKLVNKTSSPAVIVVGAGSLGNHVLINLVQKKRLAHIIIIDFDTIEAHNIPLSPLFNLNDANKGLYKAQIAAERIKKINSEVNITPIVGDVVSNLGLGILRKANLVISCVDNRLARLYINRYCHLTNTPWINGGVGKEEGDVEVFVPGHSCYECQLTPLERREIRLRMSCSDLKARYDDSQANPQNNHIASKVAELQVLEAFKLLQRADQPESSGKLMRYNQIKDSIEYLNFRKNVGLGHLKRNDGRPLCMTEAPMADINSLKEIHNQLTVHELFSILQSKFESEKLKLYLNRPLMPSLKERIFPDKPVAMDKRRKQFENSYEVNMAKYSDVIDENFPWPYLSLNDLGVPKGDILELWTNNDKVWIELGRDVEQAFEYLSTATCT